jgi:hypothetical protein
MNSATRYPDGDQAPSDLFDHATGAFGEGGGVILEKLGDRPSRGEERVERLRKARLHTRLSTDELLALTRGGEP